MCTIEDALRSISLPQPVQVTSVTKGGAVVDATQQVLIDALPSILVLHLKRFYYDTAVNGVVKIGKQVQFGPELDIPSGGTSVALRGESMLNAPTDAMAPAKRVAHPPKYKLFGGTLHARASCFA